MKCVATSIHITVRCTATYAIPTGALLGILGKGTIIAVKALSPAAKTIIKVPLTMAGKYATRMSKLNPMLTTAEARLMNTTSEAWLRGVMAGKGVDRAFRYHMGKNLIYRAYSKLGLVKLGATNRGADMVGQGFLRQYWWDVTTKASWGRHVSKYGSGGTGLFYK